MDCFWGGKSGVTWFAVCSGVDGVSSLPEPPCPHTLSESSLKFQEGKERINNQAEVTKSCGEKELSPLACGRVGGTL